MCDRLIRISTQDGCDARLQEYFYLLFLPLIWIASRNGLSGAAVGSCMVQVGVVVGAQIGSLQSLAIVELQVLVTALTLTGLSLGIIVDERERVLEDFKSSLRLAAASELAGAIAHEINQPLSAMHNYGRACQISTPASTDALPERAAPARRSPFLDTQRRPARHHGGAALFHAVKPDRQNSSSYRIT